MGFNDNSKTGEYPDVIFQPLSRLQELTIDSFKEAKFSSGFGAMKSLTALNLSGTSAHCNIEILYNDSLSVFNSSSISTLDLSSCNIYKMHVDALAPLKHLKKFNLENSPIGLHKSLQVLHGLRGTNMSSLNFKKVDNEYFSIIDRIYDEQLLSEYLQYLETICVSELNLAENNILYIDLESLFNKSNIFSRCIKHLDVHGNILYGNYTNLSVDFFITSNLEYVDVSRLACYLETNISRFLFLNMKSDIIYRFPRKLKTLIIDAFIKDLSVNGNYHFDNKTNVLEKLSASYFDRVSLEGSVIGFDKLKTLKITHNLKMTLAVSFFDTFPGLENLYLNDVSLPKNYFCQNSIRLFSNLSELMFLDLSSNGIRCLSKGIFRSNPKLQTLILSNNKFRIIPFSINDCTNLLTLKMDHNKIEFIEKSTTSSLDKHAHKNSFYLDLTGNTFACVCGKNVYFIFWLQGNNYTYNRGQYSCTTGTGSTVRVMDLNAERLWRHCAGQMWLSIAVPLSIFIILVYVSSFSVIKHKTQAIYFFKNLIRKCTMCPTRADFEFDICLCYADRDWREACLAVAEHLERRHNYKIYLHDRNSIPGEPLAESIMYGINNSWKTILLFTHNFIDDGWSWFTVQVAVSAVTWRTPYRLIVLRDPRRACELPDCILCVVDEDRIIPMPDQEVETSWDDLVRLI